MKIVLDKICKSFGEQTVLHDFSATFEQGAHYCLMGASGSGKTTLINLLLGLESPDSGEYTGRESRFSCVFQDERLLSAQSPITNVRAMLPQKLSDESIAKAFSRMGFTPDDLEKPASELSGGMQRRVSIVRALLAESDVVIMDEPFKGLDEALKARVIEYVLEETEGKTLIVATHEADDARVLNATTLLVDKPE